MLSTNGPGFRARAMHCKTTSCVRFFTLRAALPKRSIEVLSVSSRSCSTLSKDNGSLVRMVSRKLGGEEDGLGVKII